MLLGNILFLQAGVVLVDVDGSSVTLPARDALWLAEEIEKHRKELEETVQAQKRQSNKFGVQGETSATWQR